MRGGRGFAPDPAGGACSTHPDPLARLRALLLKGREGMGGKLDGRGREGGGEGRGEKGKWYPQFWEKRTPLLTAAVADYRPLPSSHFLFSYSLSLSLSLADGTITTSQAGR